jgi:hypothetical protein
MVPGSGVNYRQFGDFPTHVVDCPPQVPLEPGGFTLKFGIGLDMSIKLLGLPQSLAPGEGGGQRSKA